uniref:Ig-like domain-containing protein n=1 Tax=Seriola lalandi dorsalis TaxID=1841481 RepID=A0A3B4XXR6_SERLL
MTPFRWPFGLRLFLIMGIFRLLIIGPACALEITSHIKYYYVARDSSVTLNCEFVLDSENLGHMDIEWNILAENRDQDDNTIICYTAATIYNNLYGPLKHRVYFTSPEPQNGIASLTITDLKLTDSGTYQCMVKKLPEIGIKNFILSVMERPSMPVCYMDGEAVAGEDLRLRCRSSQGTPPMDYRWSKTSGNQKLPNTAFADTIEGDLYLDKITESDTGTYLCTVLNLVGIEECELILSFPPLLSMYYVYVTIAAAVVDSKHCLHHCSFTAFTICVLHRRKNKKKKRGGGKRMYMEICYTTPILTHITAIIYLIFMVKDSIITLSFSKYITALFTDIRIRTRV